MNTVLYVLNFYYSFKLQNLVQDRSCVRLTRSYLNLTRANASSVSLNPARMADASILERLVEAQNSYLRRSQEILEDESCIRVLVVRFSNTNTT